MSKDLIAAHKVLDELKDYYFSTKIIWWDHTERVALIGHRRQGDGQNIPDDEFIADSFPLVVYKAMKYIKENYGE